MGDIWENTLVSSVTLINIFSRHFGSSCHCQKQDPELEALWFNHLTDLL